jgi:hypothetical protein
MTTTIKKASKVVKISNMSLEDIKKLVDSAIKQNPVVFNRLAEI